jgi:hypothetical protein
MVLRPDRYRRPALLAHPVARDPNAATMRRMAAAIQRRQDQRQREPRSGAAAQDGDD